MSNSDANTIFALQNDKESIDKDSKNNIQEQTPYNNSDKYKHDSNKILDSGLRHKMNDSRIDHESHAKSPNIINIKGTDKDKYDSNTFLPQEKEKNWYEVIGTVYINDTGLNDGRLDHESHAKTPNITNIKGTNKDKYDSNTYLPQKKEMDWFEVIDTVDIKDARMIDINMPIDVGGIGHTHANAIYNNRSIDIDSDKVVCPKFVVSPWLQSSWEPDRSSKSLCD